MGLRAGLTICALFVWGCGGSSDSSLFKGSGSNGMSCSTGAPCVGDQFCAGHQTCGADGTPHCSCESANGGSTGVSGSTGASGETSNTGGIGGTENGTGGVVDQGGAPGSGGSTLVSDSGTPLPRHDAGGPVTCPVGDYKAKLTGNYAAAGGISNADVGSSVTFTVAADGSISGKYTGPTNSNGTLSGTIDCANGHAVIAVAGTYGAGLVKVQFGGTLMGTYSRAEGKFVDGTWTLTEPGNQQDGGQGSWAQQ